MKKISKNKKTIITIAVILVVVVLVASIFIDVSFAGTPFESNLSNGSTDTYNISRCEKYVLINPTDELRSIVWPERPYCPECNGFFAFSHLETTNYYVRFGNDGIDTYNRNTGEVKNVFLGKHGNISAVVTEKEICFSYWQEDVANFPIDTEDAGLYKYSYETGEIEKICDRKLINLTVINKHILLGTDRWWGIPKIIFIF